MSSGWASLVVLDAEHVGSLFLITPPFLSLGITANHYKFKNLSSGLQRQPCPL